MLELGIAILLILLNGLFALSELAIVSAHLLLDSFNLLDRPREVIRWVDRFMAQPRFMRDREFAGQMVSVVGALDAKTKTINVESITAVK